MSCYCSEALMKGLAVGYALVMRGKKIQLNNAQAGSGLLLLHLMFMLLLIFLTNMIIKT